MIINEGLILGFPSISVTAKRCKLAVVPGIGGRIMEFGADGVNLLYQNEKLSGHRPHYEAANAEEMLAIREHDPFLLYGGEKTWLAPQSDWGGFAPYADLDHGKYECRIIHSEEGGIVRLVLTSPVCRETKLQLVRTITCREEENYIDIEQKLINRGSSPVTKGLWQVTMLNRDGVVDIPDGTSARPENPIPQVHAHNASPAYDEETGWHIDIRNNALYKVGFNSDAGETSSSHIAANGKTYTLTKRFPVDLSLDYPHGTVIEVFNSDEYPYFELEVHSPSYTLQPGESASFTVRWELMGSEQAAGRALQ